MTHPNARRYLHQHLIDDYISCWQQGLANGETDASVCDIGTSRWFNYYLEGAFWSISQDPHMYGKGVAYVLTRERARARALIDGGTLPTPQYGKDSAHSTILSF